MPLSSRLTTSILLPEHAARGIDLLDRQLHALLVGLEEGREDLVAVELADLDRVPARPAGAARRRDGRGAGEQTMRVSMNSPSKKR